jgi:hypothetical protein
MSKKKESEMVGHVIGAYKGGVKIRVTNWAALSKALQGANPKTRMVLEKDGDSVRVHGWFSLDGLDIDKEGGS